MQARRIVLEKGDFKLGREEPFRGGSRGESELQGIREQLTYTLAKRSVNYGSMGEMGPSARFINRVSLEHSHPPSFMYHVQLQWQN